MKPIRNDEAAHFFDEFVEAFATFDGDRVAERYRAPFLAIDAEGTTTCLDTREKIARYFQTFLDDYRAQGCRACSYDELEVAAAGTAGALLTVTWDLVREDRTPVQSWRESYLVVREEARLVVVASVDHAG